MENDDFDGKQISNIYGKTFIALSFKVIALQKINFFVGHNLVKSWFS